MTKRKKNVRWKYAVSFLSLVFLMFFVAVPSLLVIPCGETIVIEAYATFPTGVDADDSFEIAFPVEMITYDLMDPSLRSIIVFDHPSTMSRTMNDVIIYIEFIEEDGKAVVHSASLERPESDIYIEAEYRSLMINDDDDDDITIADVIGITVSYPWPDYYIRQGNDHEIVDAFGHGSVLYTIRIWRGRYLIRNISPLE